MPLFQHSVLKKYLGELDKERLDAAWQRFQHHFDNAIIQQNILHAKEEEYQEGFVRDLFVNVLGYTLKPQPDYNFVLEQKSTSDATKSDGAILSAEGNVIAVIELKDTTTADLGKVERQAFGYKHQHKDCRYIITSNFQQLRFYINDAIDHEAFDLFRLDKNSFALLYCCLQQKALQSDAPLRMKQQSLAAEENVTKKLYDDYSRFKKQLFENITRQNKQYDSLLLFKKTQKLLDRFLFILFAEDRGLLPPNSVREILNQWEQLKELDNYVPLYERFKKYFGYLNTGYSGKQYDIFAYNGGLFAPDEVLDNIAIDDALLYASCKGLSNYDFESEVDVNILGHIFEHSLNEIEEIEQQLSEGGIINEKKTSRRKKDGVFYTPRYITKYIVENTVGALCTQKRKELNIIDEDFTPQKRKATRQQLLQKLETYRAWLLQLTICDPACGSGAFLNQALEFLITEHQSIDTLKAKLFGDTITFTDVENSILENNLYGVDINEEAVNIAKLSLWLRTARKGRKLNNLSDNIKCGNSLIDDAAIAGDKAFNWQKEFPLVFADERKYFFGSIDEFKRILVRYKKTPEELDAIFEQMDQDRIREIEKILNISITSVRDYVETAIIIIHGGRQPMMWLNLMRRTDETTAFLKELSENNRIPLECIFTVIIENLLKDVDDNFDLYADELPSEVVPGFDVVIGNPPYGATLTKKEKKYFDENYETTQYNYDTYCFFFEKSFHLLNFNGYLGYITPNTFLVVELGDRLRRFLFENMNLIELFETFNVFEDAVVEPIVSIFNKSKLKNANNVKVYLQNRGDSKFISKEFLNKNEFGYSELFEKPNLIFNYRAIKKERLLIQRIRKESKELSTFAKVTAGVILYEKGKGVPTQDAETLKLKPYTSFVKENDRWMKLIRGTDVQRYSLNWSGEYVLYGKNLAAPRKEDNFLNDKLFVRRTDDNLMFSFDYQKMIGVKSVHCVLSLQLEIDNKYLLALLNSKLLNWVFRFDNFHMIGKPFAEIKLVYVERLPIIISEDQLPFIAKADIMLSKNKELQTVKQQFLQLLQSKFEGVEGKGCQPSKKLQEWPGLSFSQFLKELDKQKIKLSLSAQAEWMPYFETEKAKANAIQQLIDKTDKEIDEMVYQLYGLTEEERRLVENL